MIACGDVGVAAVVSAPVVEWDSSLLASYLEGEYTQSVGSASIVGDDDAELTLSVVVSALSGPWVVGHAGP